MIRGTTLIRPAVARKPSSASNKAWAANGANRSALLSSGRQLRGQYPPTRTAPVHTTHRLSERETQVFFPSLLFLFLIIK